MRKMPRANLASQCFSGGNLLDENRVVGRTPGTGTDAERSEGTETKGSKHVLLPFFDC
jgi:hypothetical protein